MTRLDEQGRPEPPLAADETATLLGFLEYQRSTLAWTCSGLDAAGLQATVGASSMTLGRSAQAPGLRRGRLVLPLAARPRPRATVGHGGLEGRPRLGLALRRRRQLLALWQDAAARSRTHVAEALAGGGLERLSRRTWPDGGAPSLR